jgi:mono/diheme cytochrome c family protein
MRLNLDIPRAGAALRAAVLIVAGLYLGADAHAQTFRELDYSGAELFQRFCSACHGAEGKGDGPVARTLNVMVPNLTQLALRNGGEFPVQRVEEYIDGRSPVAAHGSRTMPVWGYEFWVEEGADRTAERNARELIDRLVEYLESIQQMPPLPAEPR